MTIESRFYIRVEVDFFDHPKTVAVGDRLAFRHLRALAWCHRHKTDGHLPRAVADRIVGAKGIASLASAGLWEACEDGWCIHDYLKHQQSRADLDRASEAGRKGAAARYANR